MAMTTTTEIPSAVSEYYDRNLLERAVEENLHDQFGQMRPMKARMGKTIKFRRYEALGDNPENYRLDEGVTPDGEQLSKTDVSATLVQYGNYVTLTDIIEYTSPDPVLTEAGMVLGEQMGEIRDLVIRDIIVTANNVILENGSQAAANVASINSTIELNGIKLAVQTLRTGNAKVLKQVIRASVGINTSPIAASYCAITHNLKANTIRGLTGFVEYQKYAQPGELLKNEVGQVWDVRFAWTNNAKWWDDAGASNADVYATMIFGANAYGITGLERGTAKNLIKPLASGGTADPLEQRATSGWKMLLTAAVLNSDFMVVYKHT